MYEYVCGNVYSINLLLKSCWQIMFIITNIPQYCSDLGWLIDQKVSNSSTILVVYISALSSICCCVMTYTGTSTNITDIKGTKTKTKWNR